MKITRNPIYFNISYDSAPLMIDEGLLHSSVIHIIGLIMIMDCIMLPMIMVFFILRFYLFALIAVTIHSKFLKVALDIHHVGAHDILGIKRKYITREMRKFYIYIDLYFILASSDVNKHL